MKVAAISHSCVIDVNQIIFAELLKQPDVELKLIAPEKWTSSLRGTVDFTAMPELENCCIPLPVRFSGYMHFHWYPGLNKILDEFKPDLLYVDEEPYSMATSMALRYKRRSGCRFVFYTKQNLLKQYLPPFSWMQHSVLAETDHAMAVSNDAADVLRTRGYKGGITELAHGVDNTLLTPQDQTNLRRRLRVRPPIIGYVGRIAPEKGVWDLFHATKILVGRIGPTFTILLIGEGEARTRLEEAALRELPPGVFVFTGSVAHHAVPKYLNALDVLVLPSRTKPNWKEQFGRVLIEALACEVPLIGSSSGHIPELIRSTGGGLVFNEGDAQDLADKIEFMIMHPAQAREMAVTGHRSVTENFAYPKLGEKLYATLKKVLEDTN